MLLQRLGLYGFKSFAEKTDIEFGRGITAIVGPNGSGKSNITDAIRWVLGEQSIRNLRGAKLEDVIFAGSSSRRQMGLAEVALTFDNSDGVLPLDFNEVTITRRVFRSGDSEYYINKSACRLKDIHELLTDTGLGRDSMTVISQNKVDEVLNSRPEERRFIFEEAAGITKYKQRKKEALRKLDDTAQNLTRVADITAELDNQLEPLAESAARTTRYNELYAEFVKCQASILINKLTKAEQMVQIARQEKQSLADTEIKLSTALSIKESEEVSLRTDLTKTDEDLSTLMADINRLTNDLEKLDGQKAVLLERISQAQHSKERIEEEKLSSHEQLKGINEKLDQTGQLFEEKQQQIAALKAGLADNNKEHSKVVSLIQRYDQQIETGKDKTFDHLQELVTQRNAGTTIERELTKLKMLKANYLDEKTDFEAQFSAAQANLKAVMIEVETLSTAIAENNQKQNELTNEKQVVEQELNNLLQNDRKLSNVLNENKSRLKVLIHMQQEFEGFGRGIKNILKSNAPWHSGICGAVTQILKVEQKFITAIEIALGGALQHIITENEDIAKQAINYLKAGRFGRATFLPLTTIKPAIRRDTEIAAAKSAGALGFASKLVDCDIKYRRIIEYLLGRTIIAEHIDAAYEIARRSSFTVKVVTLDGELISPGGSMTGGTSNRRDASFLSRSKDIEALETRVNITGNQLNHLKEEIEKREVCLAEINQNLHLGQEYRRRSEVRQAELTAHSDKVKADINRLQLAVSTLIAELEGCEDESNQLQQKLADTKNAVIQLETRDLAHKQMIDEWQKKLNDLYATKEKLSAGLTEQKVSLSAFEQNAASIIENRKQLLEYAESLTLKQNNLREEQIQVENQIVNTREELSGITNIRDINVEKKSLKEQQYKECYALKLDLLAATQKIDKDLKDVRRKHSEIETRLHEMELLNTKYGYEVTRYLDELNDQYSLSREEATKLYRADDPEKIQSVARSLEADIAALGPVNPAAIEEYNKLKERRQFLQNQYDDLIAAKEYLASIISDIDKTMAGQFNEAFHKINSYFGEIFIKLFGGGIAEIKLSDPGRLLDTGIDIIVQPPGKKLQNLVLLSGGERALTVIALLFAFLSYRPSPFVVVDEIDAPLDEANLRRFSAFLRDYANNTQFIVVTHRKGTMEAADVMHGVTIEEAGISRLVSVKFDEKAG